MTSLDGITWSTTIVVGLSGVRSIAYGNGRYVAVGDMGAIYTSSDATNWNSTGTVIDGRRHYLRAAFGESKFVVIGLEGWPTEPQGVLMLTSIDGINFTQVARPPPVYATVAYGHGKFVAIGRPAQGGAVIFTSTDGTEWAAQSSGSTAESPETLYYANGTFIAVTDIPGSVGWTSFDGITWDRRNLTPNTGLHGITFGDGTFVTVGNDGTILQSANVGAASFEGPHGLANGVFRTSILGEIGRSYQLQISNDLKAWTTKSVFTPTAAMSLLEDQLSTNSPLGFYRVISE
jgi:hypothetical protein